MIIAIDRPIEENDLHFIVNLLVMITWRWQLNTPSFRQSHWPAFREGACMKR